MCRRLEEVQEGRGGAEGWRRCRKLEEVQVRLGISHKFFTSGIFEDKFPQKCAN